MTSIRSSVTCLAALRSKCWNVSNGVFCSEVIPIALKNGYARVNTSNNMDFSSIRGTIKKDYNISALTWFKVGGFAEVFFKPADLEDLILFLKQNSDTNLLKSLSISSRVDGPERICCDQENTTGDTTENISSQANGPEKSCGDQEGTREEFSILQYRPPLGSYSSLNHLPKSPTPDTLPITILGAGSNIIIRDGGISGVVIKLTKSFCDIEIYKNHSYKGVDFSSTLNTPPHLAALTSRDDQISSNRLLSKLDYKEEALEAYEASSRSVHNAGEDSSTDTTAQFDTILLSVGAGCLNYNLAKFAVNNSITGLEFLACIPGSIGGGIAMNAGAYGKEFKDIVIAVEAIDRCGNMYILLRDQIGFEYRGNNLPTGLIYTRVILQADLGEFDKIRQKMDHINESRNLSQPMGERTGGSSFANPEISILEAFEKGYVADDFLSKFTNDGDDLSITPLKAWQLIDYAGLRGKKIGDAEISNKHCNFMINHGKATARDIENLGNHAQKAVKYKTGITLKWEIKRIGNES